MLLFTDPSLVIERGVAGFPFAILKLPVLQFPTSRLLFPGPFLTAMLCCDVTIINNRKRNTQYLNIADYFFLYREDIYFFNRGNEKLCQIDLTLFI